MQQFIAEHFGGPVCSDSLVVRTDISESQSPGDGFEGICMKWCRVSELFQPHLFDLHQELSRFPATPMF